MNMLVWEFVPNILRSFETTISEVIYDSIEKYTNVMYDIGALNLPDVCWLGSHILQLSLLGLKRSIP